MTWTWKGILAALVKHPWIVLSAVLGVALAIARWRLAAQEDHEAQRAVLEAKDELKKALEAAQVGDQAVQDELDRLAQDDAEAAARQQAHSEEASQAAQDRLDTLGKYRRKGKP